MQFRKILSVLALVLVAWLQLAIPAAMAAGVAGRVQVGDNTKPTFRCETGFIAPVASTTVISELAGSASKTLVLKRVYVNLQVLANGTFAPKVYLVKRSTANSGGTSSTPTVVAVDSNDSTTGVGTVKSYTANPTTGTLVGNVASGLLGAGYLSTVGHPQPFVLYEARPDCKSLTLRGTAEHFDVDFGGTKPDGTTPTVSTVWEWTAE